MIQVKLTVQIKYRCMVDHRNRKTALNQIVSVISSDGDGFAAGKTVWCAEYCSGSNLPYPDTAVAKEAEADAGDAVIGINDEGGKIHHQRVIAGKTEAFRKIEHRGAFTKTCISSVTTNSPSETLPGYCPSHTS